MPPQANQAVGRWFLVEYKRAPRPTDLQEARFTRQRVMVERYQYLAHGILSVRYMAV